MEGCVMCDRGRLRSLAEVYVENDLFVYASTRDPRDPPEVLPGSGVAVPVAHKPSPFDFSDEEWVALGEVVPRFDDEPRRDAGGRVGIKEAANVRPDPSAPGSGRARLFGTGV